MHGTIKTLVADRGFGFIRDGAGKEWFFHRTDVLPRKDAFVDLSVGDAVTFEEGDSDKGPRAADVRLV